MDHRRSQSECANEAVQNQENIQRELQIEIGRVHQQKRVHVRIQRREEKLGHEFTSSCVLFGEVGRDELLEVRESTGESTGTLKLIREHDRKKLQLLFYESLTISIGIFQAGGIAKVGFQHKLHAKDRRIKASIGGMNRSLLQTAIGKPSANELGVE